MNKEYVWAIAAAITCAVAFVCVTWRLNVMDEQTTQRELISVQRDAVKAQVAVAYELRKANTLLER